MKEFMGIYAKSICGAISGWDRIRFRGTIRWLASTQGLNSYLGTRRILLKDIDAFREAFQQARHTPERIPPKLKDLIAMPDFPEKLITMIQKAAHLSRKSNRILR